MAVHLFAPQSYDFPSNYQRKISVIRSPFPICLLFICVIYLIAIVLPPISLAVFFGVPTGEVLPRISFLLREGNVLRP